MTVIFLFFFTIKENLCHQLYVLKMPLREKRLYPPASPLGYGNGCNTNVKRLQPPPSKGAVGILIPQQDKLKTFPKGELGVPLVFLTLFHRMPLWYADVVP